MSEKSFCRCPPRADDNGFGGREVCCGLLRWSTAGDASAAAEVRAGPPTCRETREAFRVVPGKTAVSFARVSKVQKEPLSHRGGRGIVQLHWGLPEIFYTMPSAVRATGGTADQRSLVGGGGVWAAHPHLLASRLHFDAQLQQRQSAQREGETRSRASEGSGD